MRVTILVLCLAVAHISQVAAQRTNTAPSESILQLPSSPNSFATGTDIERYRKNLESFRLNLEQGREKKQLELPDYENQLLRYRDGIQSYRQLIRASQTNASVSTSAKQRPAQVMTPELRNSVTRLRVDLADEVGQIRTAQDAATLERNLTQTRQQILEQLSAPEFEAMRAYVRDRLPNPQGAWAKGGSEPKVRNGYVLDIQSLLNTLNASADNPVVTVVFSSTPTAARVELTPKYGTHGRVEQTEATFDNVFRGIYVYEVKLTGFKTAREEMDLVASAMGRMTCTLAPSTATNDSTCSRR